MSKITKEEVEHVAQLSRVEIIDLEKEKYSLELSEILNYVDELGIAPTEDIEVINQISGLKNIARKDEIVSSLKNEEVLANAPEKDGNFIKVKKVFE